MVRVKAEELSAATFGADANVSFYIIGIGSAADTKKINLNLIPLPAVYSPAPAFILLQQTRVTLPPHYDQLSQLFTHAEHRTHFSFNCIVINHLIIVCV